jgi:hypothetical protein
MRDHEGDIKGFYHLSRAWYGKPSLDAMNKVGVVDEVMFGYFSLDGGTSGEMSMRWMEVGNEIVPRLEVFDDGWSALARLKDSVIDKLGEVDSERITPEEFCEMLEECGFKDLTPTEQ